VNQPPVYVLRRMHHDDIDQVTAIDRLSFPLPWSANAYRYEVGRNPSSTMITLALGGGWAGNRVAPLPPARPGVFGLLDRLTGRHTLPGAGSLVVAYGGFWFSQRRAHISTIAVHPSYRGHHLGDLVLAGMVRLAMSRQALVISLEVRVSNTAAIALYRKHEFGFYGIKRRYYRDNGEDAHDMRVAPVDALFRARFEARWADLQTRLTFVDRLSEDTFPGTNA